MACMHLRFRRALRMVLILTVALSGWLARPAEANNIYYGNGILAATISPICTAEIPIALNAGWTMTGCDYVSWGVPYGNDITIGILNYPQPIQIGSSSVCTDPNIAIFYNTAPAKADCVSTMPPVPNMAKNKSCTPNSGCVGDPINAGTGNKFDVITDFSVGGSSPLAFTRFYNSMPSSTQPGQLGIQWRSNYDRSLTYIPLDLVPPTGDPVAGTNLFCSPLGACLQPNEAPLSLLSTSISTDPTAYQVVISNPSGDAYTFHWNGSGWVHTDADVLGQLTMSTDGSGNVIGWTFVNPQDETESYNASGQLLSITSRNGVTQTLGYSGGAQPVSVTDSFNHQLQFAYGSNGLLSTLTDPSGGQWAYAYDTNGNLITLTGPDAKVRTWQYSNTSFPNALTGVIDENGILIDSTTYDIYGRAISNAGGGGVSSTSLSYGSNYASSQVTTALGDVETRTFIISLGVMRVTQLSHSTGGTRSMAWDANGNMASSTDFNGNVTTYTYDLTRNLETSRTEASGTAQARTITTTWNPNYRLPLTIAEPGRLTTYTYDGNGNRLSKTIADTASGTSQVWTWTYNTLGQVLTAVGPRTDISATTTYTYDGSGNLSTLTNALGQVTHFSNYTGSGYPQTMVDPNGTTTTLSYDLRNRLLSQSTGSLTTSYTYDAAGQLIQVTLPDGNSLSYTYDADHRLTTLSDNAGDQITYTLDAMGNHLSETLTGSASIASLHKKIDQGLAHARLFATR